MILTVHGGWGNWSPWGTCSSTCGMGLQHRQRACDSPYPSKGGNQCQGESIAYDICAAYQCAGNSTFLHVNNVTHSLIIHVVRVLCVRVYV